MRIPQACLDDLLHRGFMVIEDFLDPHELAQAQAGVWDEFPRPDDYFTDPSAYAHLQAHQLAGLRPGPFSSWALNRIAFHPDLVDAAERFLGSSDLRLYKTELWAKYSGGIDYDQALHRDFGNHSLVVPSASQPARQVTCFILLSDVSEHDGPTKVVPIADGADIPYWPMFRAPGELEDREVSITGPAGTLFAYRTDVLHRGSAMTGHPTARFALLTDFEVWDTRWTGKIAWPDRALAPAFVEMMERASPRERQLFGFPRPEDPYWDDQTRADVQRRYPRMDMTPYR